MNLYEIRNLVLTYDGTRVLDIPELTLETGAITALLGPNGAGKSTLLRQLAFLERPDSGHVVFQGASAGQDGNSMRSLRRKVVLVDQHPILFTGTVARNVAFGPSVRGLSRTECRRIVHETLDMVHMRDFENAHGPSMSGGETQRVAIARALACRPQVLLLDEPTASVDTENRIVIENIIRQIRDELGISVVFCSHDRQQSSRLADRRVYLFRGRPFSRPLDNIFRGRVEHRDDGLRCVVSGVPLPIAETDQDEVMISIDSACMSLHREHESTPGGVALRGEITQTSRINGGLRVIVDVGFPLMVLVTGDTSGPASWVVGERVRVALTSAAIRIL